MGLTLLRVQTVFGLLIIGFAISKTLWLSQALLFVSGAALIIVFSLVTSLVQLIAPNEMRGRVMSIFMLAFRGGAPLGNLLGGYLAGIISVPTVLVMNGCLLATIACYFLIKSHGVREL
jgi:MFS family permease